MRVVLNVEPKKRAILKAHYVDDLDFSKTLCGIKASGQYGLLAGDWEISLFRDTLDNNDKDCKECIKKAKLMEV